MFDVEDLMNFESFSVVTIYQDIGNYSSLSNGLPVPRQSSPCHRTSRAVHYDGGVEPPISGKSSSRPEPQCAVFHDGSAAPPVHRPPQSVPLPGEHENGGQL